MLARRYHSDPLTVAEWGPLRVGMALRCMAAGIEAERAAIEDERRKGKGKKGGATVDKQARPPEEVRAAKQEATRRKVAAQRKQGAPVYG